MFRYSSHDPYLDPVSGVLKNRFGITDETTLERTEASLVAVRSYELAQRPLPVGFDLTHLQAIHRYLFGDVYEWAGQLRTIDIAKGGNAFAHHGYIMTAADPVFVGLAHEQHLAGLLPPAFSARAAHYLGEINALHPFREGNGRAQREFVSHLAQANGFFIAWEKVAAEAMLQASIKSFHSDLSELAAIIHDNLNRL